MIPKKLKFSTLFLLLASLPAGATTHCDVQLSNIAQAVENLGYTRSEAQKLVVPVKYNEGPSHFILSAEEMPWTSDFFPMREKGIAGRWQNPATSARRGHAVMPAPDYYYEPGEVPTDFADPGQLLAATDRETVIARLKALTPEQIDHLSPVEKFDILKGNYDFVATRTELRMRGPSRINSPQSWEGFCNGVCAASINVAEPKHAVTLTNPDGVEVSFQPNDIKALASASYFFVEKYAAVGSPNRTALDINFDTLPDPGALDWALTHYLGGLHKPFVVDTFPGAALWNHVAVGYTRNLEEIKLAGDDAPAGVHYEVVANVTITYNKFVDHETANGPTAANTAAAATDPDSQTSKGGKFLSTRYYRYELFLNREKKIVGGRWVKEGPHRTVDAPDFLWFPAGRGTDSIDGNNPYLSFDTIQDLVTRSTQ